MLISPGEHVAIVVSVRHYPSRSPNLHGLAFGENTSNETGCYLGFRLIPVTHWTLSGYYDQYRRSESSVFPSGGRDLLAHLGFSPVSGIVASFRYQRKVSVVPGHRTDRHGFEVLVDDEQQKQHLRLGVEYRLSPLTRLRGRVERVVIDHRASGDRDDGVMMYQDVSYRAFARASLSVRVIYFKTGSYGSGIPEYEDDLDGVLTVPVVSGTGTRWYLVAKYDIGESLTLSAKYSDLVRDDVKRVGTALDELPSNRDNRISLQIDFAR